MDALEFFDIILPTAGLRVIALPHGGGFRHLFGDTNKWLAEATQRIDATRLINVYFACATYKDTSSRKQSNVAFVRSFWADIDCGPGKPYGSAREAAQAVLEFCRRVGLARPYIVKSGNGIHVYWPMTVSMTSASWKVRATLLKAALKAEGVHADPSRTADEASVLRPIDTHHRKGEPKLVRLVVVGEVMDRADFDAKLLPYAHLVQMTTAASDDFDLPEGGPGNLQRVAGLNADLTAGVSDLDMARVTSAARALPAASLVARDVWRGSLLLPLAAAAVEHPSHHNVLRELAVEVSGQKGAFKLDGPHAQGFDPAAASAHFDDAVRETRVRMGSGREVNGIGSLIHAALEAGWSEDPMQATQERFATDGPVALAGELALPTDLDDHRLSRRTTVRHKRRPLHGGIAYRREVTIVVSRGGAAKSTYATTVALAVGAARPLLGIPPGPRVPVVMINLEDETGEVELKFQAAMKFHKIPHGDVHDVFIIGADNVPDLTLTTSDLQGRDVINPAGAAALKVIIQQTGAKLAILDPFSVLVPAATNDNGKMAQVMRQLKAIAIQEDCAILIVAHTKKGGDADVDGAEITAGAGAITNLARGVYTIRLPDKKTLDEIGVAFGDDGHIRELVDLKTNLKPLGERSFFRLVSVPMEMCPPDPEYPDPDYVAVATAFVPTPGGRQVPLPAVRAALERLARGYADAKNKIVPFSDSPQGRDRYYLREVATAVASHFPALTAGGLKAATTSTYAEALRCGWVETRSAPISGNQRNGVYVRWAASPWASEPLPGPFAA